MAPSCQATTLRSVLTVLTVLTVLALLLPVGCSSEESTPAGSDASPGVAGAERPVRVEGFPDAESTGVPDGVELEDWSGSLTIDRAGTVIDGRRVRGVLVVRARGVVVRRSHIEGRIEVEPTGSLVLADSLVDGGTSELAAVGGQNLTLRRVEVVGSRVSVQCADRCDVQDSWLHAQHLRPGSDWHVDGFVTNGGDAMVLRGNTLACDAVATDTGGCTAAVAAFGDFAPVTDLVVEGNLFVHSPAGFCLYAGHDPAKPYGAAPTGVRILDNVFQRGPGGTCGVYGPVTAVAPDGHGNVFRGNVWDDGLPVSVE